LLLVLALALARPSGVAGSKGGRGDAVDAVLLLDNSLSMGARAGVAPPRAAADDAYQSALKELAGPGGSVTRLDRAKAAALAVLANLPPYSTVHVLTCSDRATVLGPQAPSHLDQARPLILDVRLSSLGTDFLPGVQAAAELLAH